MDSSPFFYYNPDSHSNPHGQFLPHPNSPVCQPSTPVLASSEPSSCSVPYPSALMGSKQGNTHLKPTLHVPTPRTNFSIEQFKQSHGLPTPSSPTMMAADCADFFFVPPTPSLSISSSNSSDSGSPCMSSAVLMTPQDSHWSMDDNQMSGTITPLELHYHSNEHTPPMTPNYLCPVPQFLRAQSSPSILLSAANCPSLSPASECSPELEFCDPRNLAYPTPSPGPSFSELNIALSAVERLPEIKCEDSAFSPSFQFNEFSDSEEDIFGMSMDENETTTSLAQLQRSLEDSEYDSITDNDSVFDDGYLSVPSPSSNSSRQGSAQPFRREKKRGTKRVKTELFDSDLDMDEYIMQARQSGAPEHPIVENSFLNTFDSTMTVSTTTSSSVTPAPTDMSSCENAEAAVPKAPVVRRGRKQSLTEDPSKTFVCHIPSCGRRFRRQEHLKRHFRSLHTQDKPFSCSECGKKFSRSDNLSQHTRIHGPGAIVMDLLEEGDIVGADGAIKREDGREVGRMLMSPSEVATTLKEKLAGESKKMRRKRRRDDEC